MFLSFFLIFIHKPANIFTKTIEQLVTENNVLSRSDWKNTKRVVLVVVDDIARVVVAVVAASRQAHRPSVVRIVIILSTRPVDIGLRA